MRHYDEGEQRSPLGTKCKGIGLPGADTRDGWDERDSGRMAGN